TRHRELSLIGTDLISADVTHGGETSHIEYHSVESRYPGYNAKVTWQQAHDYCAWLADLSGQPFALPTEAQWEYSARSGGKPYAFAIANPRADKVDPIQFQKDLEAIAGEHKGQNHLSNRPSGIYGPNPAGLYDFIAFGKEWVNDWYARYPTPTPKRPLRNPTGPASGIEKVARASADGGWTVLDRFGWGKDYELYDDDDDNINDKRQSDGVVRTVAFRCVVNAPRWK
ncbi:formylglycine-generating enzyme family protein, partial [Luteimonas sp. A501]